MDVSEFPWPVSVTCTGNTFLIICVIQFPWVQFETISVGEMSWKGLTEVITWRNFDFDALPSKERLNGATCPGNTPEITWVEWCTTEVRKVIGEMVGKKTKKGGQAK